MKTKDTKLKINERITLLSILPDEATTLIMKIVKDLKDELLFTEKEIVDYQIKNVPSGGVSFSVNFEKDFELGPTSFDIIKQKLNELNKSGKIRLEHLSLWDKFVE